MYNLSKCIGSAHYFILPKLSYEHMEKEQNLSRYLFRLRRTLQLRSRSSHIRWEDCRRDMCEWKRGLRLTGEHLRRATSGSCLRRLLAFYWRQRPWRSACRSLDKSSDHGTGLDSALAWICKTNGVSTKLPSTNCILGSWKLTKLEKRFLDIRNNSVLKLHLRQNQSVLKYQAPLIRINNKTVCKYLNSPPSSIFLLIPL